jgi:hypothetical protein
MRTLLLLIKSYRALINVKSNCLYLKLRGCSSTVFKYSQPATLDFK